MPRSRKPQVKAAVRSSDTALMTTADHVAGAPRRDWKVTTGYRVLIRVGWSAFGLALYGAVVAVVVGIDSRTNAGDFWHYPMSVGGTCCSLSASFIENIFSSGTGSVGARESGVWRSLYGGRRPAGAGVLGYTRCEQILALSINISTSC